MRKKDKFTRFLEIIPGFLSWSILLTPFILSFKAPKAVALFIICFDFYWLCKAIVMGAYLISGYIHIRRETNLDWVDKLEKLKNIKEYKEELKKEIRKKKGFGYILERKKLKEELKQLEKIAEKKLNWEEIYHVILLPTYKESLDILEASVQACLDSEYPISLDKRFIFVLAIEEREGNSALEKAKYLRNKYGKRFFKFLITIHPDGIEGELKAKGANVNWAGRKLKLLIDFLKIPYEKVLVSCFDADTRPHRKYFTCLTYKYLINPSRIKRSYQPIPLYANNIWEVPPLNRVVAFGSTFWQMIESVRPKRLINFSSQAMSLKTLVDIDFWDKSIVSEDSRQYYRAFFRYKGDHKVIPIFCPVYMDAVLGRNLWETLKNQYKQKRRWAWGVEHFPYLIKESISHKEIPILPKLILIFRLLNGHLSWATASLLIAFVGWMPFIFSPSFRSTVLAYNMPLMARDLLTLTWIGIFISSTISILLLPPKPLKYSKIKYAEMILQWVLVPLTAIFFGSIPAIDAQTRFALGKELGFWVTPKYRRN